MSQLPLYTTDQADVLAQVIQTLRLLAHTTYGLDDDQGMPYALGLMARLYSETLERVYNAWMYERDRCICAQRCWRSKLWPPKAKTISPAALASWRGCSPAR